MDTPTRPSRYTSFHEETPETPLRSLRSRAGTPLARLPHSGEDLTCEEALRRATRQPPKDNAGFLKALSVRRRGLCPWISVQKRQVREMTASVRTLDVFGFVRDDCVNPMVPAACPSHSTRIVRDENSMYQLTRFTPPITAFLPSCR